MPRKSISVIVAGIFLAVVYGQAASQQEQFLTATEDSERLIIRSGPMWPTRFDTLKVYFATREREEIDKFRVLVRLEEPIDPEGVVVLNSFCGASYVFEFHHEDGRCTSFGLVNCDSALRSRFLSHADVPLTPESRKKIDEFLEKQEALWKLAEIYRALEASGSSDSGGPVGIATIRDSGDFACYFIDDNDDVVFRLIEKDSRDFEYALSRFQPSEEMNWRLLDRLEADDLQRFDLEDISPAHD